MVTTKSSKDTDWLILGYTGWWCFILGMVLGINIERSMSQPQRTALLESGYAHYTVDQKTGVARFELIKPEDFKYVPKQPEK